MVDYSDIRQARLRLHRAPRATIFISSPYSAETVEDRERNVKTAMVAADILFQLGYEPFCPLLFHYHDLHFPRTWNDWMTTCLTWLEKCDAVYRLPGESRGADIEVERAVELGIPVIRDLHASTLFALEAKLQGLDPDEFEVIPSPTWI